MKAKKRKAPPPAKPVTKTSHVQISAQTLCELIAAYCNNMHQNEGRSIPCYAFVAVGSDGVAISTTNMVRPIDEARTYAAAFSELLRRAHEGVAPEMFKDRGPRVERLDR